jgi:hypothetical protein
LSVSTSQCHAQLLPAVASVGRGVVTVALVFVVAGEKKTWRSEGAKTAGTRGMSRLLFCKPPLSFCLPSVRLPRVIPHPIVPPVLSLCRWSRRRGGQGRCTGQEAVRADGAASVPVLVARAGAPCPGACCRRMRPPRSLWASRCVTSCAARAAAATPCRCVSVAASLCAYAAIPTQPRE